MPSTYNIQLEKLCQTLGLGDMLCSPQPLSGGHLHKMFALQTARGKFAVKALNPQVMLRPTAMPDYINAEKIVRVVSGHISAIPAKLFEGKAVQEVDGQSYLVFDWREGENLFGAEIGSEHCRKIGEILAKIHTTDFSALGLVCTDSGVEPTPDWAAYLQKGQEQNAPWVQLVQNNLDNLYTWSTRLSQGARILSQQALITHADLEPKNVLWHQGNPTLIDWESAGFVNPMHDLVETALYWSKGTGSSGGQGINKENFFAFIRGYKSIIPQVKANWDVVLDKGFSGLGWLEYSFKRSLWIECTDEAENQMGTEHVAGMIHALLNYEKTIPMIKGWLEEQLP